MYDNFSPFGNNYSNTNFNTIMSVVNQGMDILRNNHRTPISFNVVQSWQSYAQSVLRIISGNYSQDVYLEYLRFLTSISYLSPQEQLNKSIEKLLEIARRV